MKGIVVLTLILLAGCTSYQSLEQLETHALVSGDWSAVEERERIIAKREMRNDVQCEPGLTAICGLGIRRDRCTCVDRTTMRLLFSDYGLSD